MRRERTTPVIRLKKAHGYWDPVNTKADLACKPKEPKEEEIDEGSDEERGKLEATKKCRVCAKNEVKGHQVLHSRKMQPEGGISWIVGRVFFITVNIYQRPRVTRVAPRIEEMGRLPGQNSRRGVCGSDVDP